MLNRTKKAFTLLELIVVLLVLGVLAAIAVPTYSTLKENSVKRSVNSTLQAIDRAGEAAYASDTNLTDAATATAAAEGVVDSGDFDMTDDAAGTITVQLTSGTIVCSGSVAFVDGVGTVTDATC
jgi:prepilin-type N-terminal cleavage/methylation domain-containing protein